MGRRRKTAYATTGLVVMAVGLLLGTAAMWWLGPSDAAGDEVVSGPVRSSHQGATVDAGLVTDAAVHEGVESLRTGGGSNPLEEGHAPPEMIEVLGRVVDAEGMPAVDAEVWGIPTAETLAKAHGWTADVLPVPYQARARTRTDGDGHFALELPHVEGAGGERWPDVPMVVVEHAGHVVHAVAATGHAGGALDLGELPLRAGGALTALVRTRGIEPLEGARLLARSWVVDEAWKPAVTRAMGDALSASGVADPIDAHAARTDAEGRVRLDGLPSGRYLTEFRARGLLRHQLHEVVVAAGETTDLGVFNLNPGKGLMGVVHDLHGEPLSGVEVLVSATPVLWAGTPYVDGDDRDHREVELLRRGPLEGSRSTDAEGHFALTGLDPEDALTVSLFLEGFQPRIVRGVRAADGLTKKWGLTPNRDLRVVVHEDLPDPKLARILWTARGEARRVTGNDRLVRSSMPPSRPLEVERGGLDGSDRPRTLFEHAEQAPASAVFEVLGVGSIETALTVSAPGYAERTVVFDHRDGGSQGLVFVGLTPEARLVGHVLDAAGEGVDRATVWASPDGHPGVARSTRTDADGAFTLTRLLPGSWRVHALSVGHARTEDRIVLLQPEPARTEVTLRLRVGGRIGGKVVGYDGRVRPGVSVHVTGPESRVVRTDRGGQFAVSDLAEGYYELFSKPEGRGSASVLPGRTSEVTLLTRGGPAFAGRILDIPDPERGGLVSVIAVPLGHGGESGAVHAPAGHRYEYRIDLPHAGTWAIFAQKGEVRSADVTYQLDWEEVVVQDLVFGVGSIGGRLRDEDGTAVAGVPVFLDGLRSDLDRETETDEQGRFAFLGLPADDYNLRARPEVGTVAQVGPIDLATEEFARVDLTLAMPGSLEGEVEWAGGLAFCNVLAVDPSSNQIVALESRVFRDFSFDDLPSGPYRIVVMERYGSGRKTKLREEAQRWLDGEYLQFLPPSGQVPVIVRGGRKTTVHILAKAYERER